MFTNKNTRVYLRAGIKFHRSLKYLPPQRRFGLRGTVHGRSVALAHTSRVGTHSSDLLIVYNIYDIINSVQYFCIM